MEKTPSEEAATIKVSSIFVYAVKSCRGISISEAPVTPTGFRWDGQWLVVNEKGRAYTQRVEPRLACLEVHLPNDAFLEGWEPNNSSYLASETRPVKPNFWTRKPEEPTYAKGQQIMFSDLFPNLMASQASLDTLNGHVKEPVPINRFRPNILVDGCEPFSEDLWTDLRINKFTFQGVMLCYRCKIRMVDQETGIPGPEPNKTLKKFRSDAIVYPTRKQQGRVYFGQYLVYKDTPTVGVKGNVIKVGDLGHVLSMVNSADEVAE